MNFKKLQTPSRTRAALLLFILISVLALDISFAQASENTSTTKNIKSLIAGTALALVAHNLLELMSTSVHELGHACTNKIFAGDSIAIEIQRNPNLLAFLIFPWVGSSHVSNYDENKKLEAIVTAAGPLAGILTTFIQILLINYLESCRSNSCLTKSNNKLSKRGAPRRNSPLTFFKDYYNAVYTKTANVLNRQNIQNNDSEKSECTPSLSTLTVAFNVLKFLRFSRLVGESIYGFTPIKMDQGIGDGQHLWHLLLNLPKDNYPKIDKNLLVLTGSIMSTPMILGISKAFLERLN